jgi:SAM-dependent methyltransferase
MIWFLYGKFTGGLRQEQAVADMVTQVSAELSERMQSTPFRYDEVSSKKELLACLKEIWEQGAQITEWHFAGYGTSYGPLLGSPEWPEEISGFEWSNMLIPFAKNAKAWFYMQESAVWLAPFMAAAFQITACGCQELTSRSGMRAYAPGFWDDAADYNPIAGLYAEAFSDITVRRDECRWLAEKISLQKPGRILDIGCGNGALLAYLSGKIKQGTGVDISREAIEIAVRNNRHRENLSFTVIDGPHLPFTDHSFDAVVSMLSFRYLDWDPIFREIKRVLKPGGHILIVDMLAASPRLYEWPALLADKVKNIWHLRKHREYRKALSRLVTHPDWRRMIERHPMRPQEVFAWTLKSRFPGGQIKVLNRGVRANILSFDSGPVA